MDLSIIILTFNQKAMMLRCLASVRESIGELRSREVLSGCEVIVVDNGSVDGTQEAVEGAFANSPEFVLLYNRLDGNIGVAPGRNRGLELARGEYVMILDNDTVVNPEAIAGLLAHLRENLECGVAAPRLNYPDGAGQESFKSFPGIGVKLRNMLSTRRRDRSATEIPGEITHPSYVIGACQVFRRSLVDEIGMLDEKIFYGPEDADFCMRACRAGYSIDYLPDVAIIHDHRHLTRTSPFSRMGRRHIAALLHFYWKYRRFL